MEVIVRAKNASVPVTRLVEMFEKFFNRSTHYEYDHDARHTSNPLPPETYSPPPNGPRPTHPPTLSHSHVAIPNPSIPLIQNSRVRLNLATIILHGETYDSGVEWSIVGCDTSLQCRCTAGADPEGFG